MNGNCDKINNIKWKKIIPEFLAKVSTPSRS